MKPTDETTEIVSLLEKYILDAHYSGCKYDFVDPAQEICRRIRRTKLNKDITLALLKLIERSPDIDYGGPGPLGALLESHSEKHPQEYEELLVESVLRKPARFTVYLLFRLANDGSRSDRGTHVALLKRLSTDENAPISIRDEASECIRSLGLMNNEAQL